jgi:hypothetical protein
MPVLLLIRVVAVLAIVLGGWQVEAGEKTPKRVDDALLL